MPPKGRGNKAPVKGSSSRTSKGSRYKNLPINPSVQPPSIPKAPIKTSIDGILAMFSQKSSVETYTPRFYSNIIELDLDESYLKLILYGIAVKVTPEVIAEVLAIPLVEASSVSDLEITFELLDRVSINLWGKGQIKSALGSKNKVCHSRVKSKFGESDSDSTVDSSVLAQLCASFLITKANLKLRRVIWNPCKEYTRTVRPDTPSEGIRTTYPGRNYTRLPPTFHLDVHVRNSGAGWERRRFNFSGRTYPDHLIASTRMGEQPFCTVLRKSKVKDHLEWQVLGERYEPLQGASVINFVDYFLKQRAPAGHESADTQTGHESNGAVAGEGANFIVILFQVVYAKLDTRQGGRLVKLDTPHNKELELSLNIMEATPEDQHSHHGHQDNPNAFISMRDRMHPPRMSAPSCIVPPTEQLVIRPHIVPLLPTFHGMESENPYAHIKEFEDVCNTFREGGASIDLMRLKLFPFTLKDKAKIWLNSLRPRSKFQTSQLKRMRNSMSVWERYIEAITACPHHGFDTWLLVSDFYDGMSSLMKQLLETMCGGDFMSKNPEKAMHFLSCVAEVSRGWDEPNKGEVGKMKSQPSAFNVKAGMYTLNEDDDMKAKFAAMTRRLEELELQKMHEVQAVAETSVQVKPFPICQSYEHLMEECPTILAVREMFGD
ncbi:hypothetical protein CK203_049772 [Vitis vinifera]|uniref:Retrotransposon gag domain-containing protein n=1 Tax=Vitis vinifera TaxID=29760 RepID=A0A438H1S5_VITVI|nr:hypothetical protein CK203_049772 [Vitis vinifera]